MFISQCTVTCHVNVPDVQRCLHWCHPCVNRKNITISTPPYQRIFRSHTQKKQNSVVTICLGSKDECSHTQMENVHVIHIIISKVVILYGESY